MTVVALISFWGLDRLPIQLALNRVNDLRDQVAELVEIPDLPTPKPTRSGGVGGGIASVTATPTITPTLPVTDTPTADVTVTITATEVVTATEPAEATAEPAEPTPTPDANQYYTVQQGQTFIEIGHETGIPWRVIADINGLGENSVLDVGQKLLLPTPTPEPPAETPTPSTPETSTPTEEPATPTPPPATPTEQPTETPPSPTIYRVQAGDSLAKIGTKLGVPWREIAAANNISGQTTLRIGQELIIPAQ